MCLSDPHGFSFETWGNIFTQSNSQFKALIHSAQTPMLSFFIHQICHPVFYLMLLYSSLSFSHSLCNIPLFSPFSFSTFPYTALLHIHICYSLLSEFSEGLQCKHVECFLGVSLHIEPATFATLVSCRLPSSYYVPRYKGGTAPWKLLVSCNSVFESWSSIWWDFASQCRNS